MLICELASCRSQVEVKLDGEGPWPLPDGSSDFDIVLTPGHTEAHCCAVYNPDKVSSCEAACAASLACCHD